MSTSTRYEIPKTEHAQIGWDSRQKPETKKPDTSGTDLTHRPGRAL